MIRVTLWGTRGSIASPGRATRRYGGNTPCVQVVGYQNGEPGAVMRSDNSHLILDGGTGLATLQTSLMGGPWGHGQGELHVLLSHYHWDHLIGIPFFRPMFIKGNRIVFYGSSIQDLQSSIERLFTSVYSPLKGAENVAAELGYRQVEPDGMEVAGFRVRAAENRHLGSALSFRLEYGAHVVCYTSDHESGDPEVDARLVALARGANLWIVEAQYTVEERRERNNWGHNSHLQAVKLALEAGVKMVVLFHHDPAHDDSTLDRIGSEASEMAAGTQTQVLMARDGMVVDVA